MYEQLTCKCDERLLVLRELIKRECVPYSFWKGQIEPLCSCVIPKAVIQMDPGGLLEHSGFKLRNGTVAFGVPRAAKGMEKEITMEQQALYLLKDLFSESVCLPMWICRGQYAPQCKNFRMCFCLS